MPGGGNLIDPLKLADAGAKYRVRLLKLQQDEWIRRNTRPLLIQALYPRPQPGEKEDRRKSRLSEALVVGFNWLFYTAFKVTERGGWDYTVSRFDGTWRRTAWPEIQEEAGLSHEDVKFVLKRLEEVGFLDRNRVMDRETMLVEELWVTIHPETLESWRSQFLQDRKEAKEEKSKEEKPKDRVRDPLRWVVVPASLPTPRALAELHLGRRLVHFSNYRECLPMAIRYHQGGVTRRSQAADKRSARVAPGRIKFAIGMTEVFAPDFLGRRTLHPRRFDREGRLLITAPELEDRTRCSPKEYRGAAKFFRDRGILTLDHGDKLTRKGFWAHWSFAAFGRFLEEFPESRFRWQRERLCLVIFEAPPAPQRAARRSRPRPKSRKMRFPSRG